VEIPVVWSVVLLVAAVWNLVVWPQFWRRVTRDPRARDESGRATRFYTVHAVLVGVSVVLAVLVGVVGVLGLLG
jgi:MFS superfamily sulfate permease-like transporter